MCFCLTQIKARITYNINKCETRFSPLAWQSLGLTQKTVHHSLELDSFELALRPLSPDLRTAIVHGNETQIRARITYNINNCENMFFTSCLAISWLNTENSSSLTKT